jgi:hypothetical protein
LFEKLRRFRTRPPEDCKLILRAAFILPLTKVGLRVFGFRRWKELIEAISMRARYAPGLPTDLQREIALRAARAVASIERHGPSETNCLERSLALWWMLRSDGVEGELHIGARKEGANFQAHAWVELAGQVLNDSIDVHIHYARFNGPIAAARSETRAPRRAEF